VLDGDETRPAAAEGDENAGAGNPIGPGTTIGAYTVRSEIGRGGMGIVYLVDHDSLDRQCALKVVASYLASDEKFRERFRREAKTAAALDHPNVIPVYDAGSYRETLYLAMKFVEGREAAALARPGKPASPDLAIEIIGQAAAGLDAIHAAGMVHRDIKPANLLVVDSGGTPTGPDRPHVYITDFGITRGPAGSGATTAVGEILGSVDYIAPEQVDGVDVDHRADIYALGGVAHYLLTGSVPYDGPTRTAKLLAHRESPPPQPSRITAGLSPGVDDVIAAAMAKDPDERFATAGEFAERLSEAIAGEVTTPLRRAPRSVPAKRSPSRTRRWLAGIAIGFLLAAIAVWQLTGSGDDGDNNRAVTGVESAALPAPPTALAAGPSGVWVTSSDGRAAYRFELGETDGAGFASGNPDTVTFDSAPGAIGVGHRWVWTALPTRDRIQVFSPATDETRFAPVGARPRAIEVDRRYVWTANTDAGTISRINPDNPAEVETVDVGGNPIAIASDDKRLWVVGATGVLSNINIASLEVDPQKVRLAGRPADIEVAAGRVWVSDERRDRLMTVRTSNRETGDPLPVGPSPRGLVFANGWLWVANSGDGTITRVDPFDHETVGEPVEVGGSPVALAATASAIWVIDGKRSQLHRVPAR